MRTGPGGRGRTCTATPYQSVSSTTWIPLGRAVGREPDGRGRREFIAAVLQRQAAPKGLVEEVAPCLRIARSSHHEVSNPVRLTTKEVFCLSNSGGGCTTRTLT